MEIIDFAKAREERLEKVAKTKKEPTILRRPLTPTAQRMWLRRALTG